LAGIACVTAEKTRQRGHYDIMVFFDLILLRSLKISFNRVKVFETTEIQKSITDRLINIIRFGLLGDKYIQYK